MTVDAQLRGLGVQLDEEQVSITVDEVLARSDRVLVEPRPHPGVDGSSNGGHRTADPRRRPHRRWLAAAAAAILLVVGAVAVAVSRSDGPNVMIDDTPSTTVPPTSPTTVPASPAPTTAPAVVLTPGEPVVVDADVFTNSPREKAVVPWREGFLAITDMSQAGDLQPPTTYRAAYTTDGTAQSVTEFELPFTFASFSVSDVQLVAWSFDVYEPNPRLEIAVSTDLVDWRTVGYDLVEQVDDPSLESERRYDTVTQVVVLGDRWHALALGSGRTFWEHLLPEEVRAIVEPSDMVSYDPFENGIRVRAGSASNPSDGRTWTFTWDELGLDWQQEPYGTSAGHVVLSGDLSGDFDAALAPDLRAPSPHLVVVHDSLFFVGQELYVWSDGGGWTQFELGVDDLIRRVRSLVEVADGALAASAGGVVKIGLDGEIERLNPPPEWGFGGSGVPWVDTPVWIGGPRAGDWLSQDLWLIATEDGTDWFTLDLEDRTENNDGTYLGGATNEGLVLYRDLKSWKIVRMR